MKTLLIPLHRHGLPVQIIVLLPLITSCSRVRKKCAIEIAKSAQKISSLIGKKSAQMHDALTILIITAFCYGGFLSESCITCISNITWFCILYVSLSYASSKHNTLSPAYIEPLSSCYQGMQTYHKTHKARYNLL